MYHAHDTEPCRWETLPEEAAQRAQILEDAARDSSKPFPYRRTCWTCLKCKKGKERVKVYEYNDLVAHVRSK